MTPPTRKTSIVSYSIDIDPRAQATIAALPAHCSAGTGRGHRLELVPWSGRSVNSELNPDAPVRNLPFGAAG